MLTNVIITYSKDGNCDFFINDKNEWVNPTLTNAKDHYEICCDPKANKMFIKIFIEIVFICMFAHFEHIRILEDDLGIMRIKSVTPKDITDFIELFHEH